MYKPQPNHQRPRWDHGYSPFACDLKGAARGQTARRLARGVGGRQERPHATRGGSAEAVPGALAWGRPHPVAPFRPPGLVQPGGPSERRGRPGRPRAAKQSTPFMRTLSAFSTDDLPFCPVCNFPRPPACGGENGVVARRSERVRGGRVGLGPKMAKTTKSTQVKSDFLKTQ